MPDAGPPRIHAAVGTGAASDDFELPPPNRYESLGHVVEELRTRGQFEVRDPKGAMVGWILKSGDGFQARGHAPSLEEAPTLRTFASGRAALRLVIGYYEFTRLKQSVVEQANKIERDYLAQHPEVVARLAADRRRLSTASARSDGPRSTAEQPRGR